MRCTIFWNVTPCNLIEVHRRYRRTHCLHLQGLKVNEVNSKQAVGDTECREHPTWLYGVISQNIKIFIAVAIQTILPFGLCSRAWSAILYCSWSYGEVQDILLKQEENYCLAEFTVKIQPGLYRTYLLIEIVGISLNIWLIFLPSEIKFSLCKIWGFHGSDYEESNLLGCGTV
jgi:hypothetical protein